MAKGKKKNPMGFRERESLNWSLGGRVKGWREAVNVVR